MSLQEKANQQKLYSHVEFLTGLNPPRNYHHLDSLHRAADYIARELSDYGCRTCEQAFEAQGNTYRNIIGNLGPKTGERIIVGAHYDVAGYQPGADDNASAVAGLLETARLLSAHRGLNKRIELVAFCLEEPPFFGTSKMGSAVHANSLKEEGARVELMICFEMIGYFTDMPGSQSYPELMDGASYPNKGNFIAVAGIGRYSHLNERLCWLMNKYSQIEVLEATFATPHGLVGLSDHSSYWRNDYPAVMITDTSFLRNPHYHQVTDTIDTLDFSRMAEVVNGVAGAILEMAGTDEKK